MTRRPTVYHVGRAGDIPGGMTQVVNAYLQWPFPAVTVEVIESRGDPGDHATAVRRFASALRQVRGISRRGEPAVIVVHLSERGSFIREGTIARYAARLGLPVIAHLHGSEFAAYADARPESVGKVLQACAKVITLSEESSAVSERFVDAERVELVPNAIPAGRGGRKTRTAVFGGVVSHRKGIDVLQAAWRQAAEHHPDWTLVVAGPVRDGELVDAALPSTRWLGSVAHAELMELLEHASVAVLPSRDEAMPMFILEAMARSACVVSTTVGGIPAVLDDDHGVLIAPGDVPQLAAAFERVLADDAERSRLAERGHVRFRERYSADAVFPRVERIWLDTLEPAAALSSRSRRTARESDDFVKSTASSGLRRPRAGVRPGGAG
jgi:glycosyltransferase involved in cell wall biosynthesis